MGIILWLYWGYRDYTLWRGLGFGVGQGRVMWGVGIGFLIPNFWQVFQAKSHTSENVWLVAGTAEWYSEDFPGVAVGFGIGCSLGMGCNAGWSHGSIGGTQLKKADD